MLKNRGRTAGSRPEPDYEVVEFPSDQYMNAKLQPPPPPPPRPPTSHPLEAGASCGLCGGGGARVRCTECGRRALCASCDDMYHRHPKRRHHQRQALSQAQVRDERPPLPPKVAAPVPPPRRHKAGSDRASASPRPVTVDPRRPLPSALPAGTLPPVPIQSFTMPHTSHFATQRAQVTSHSQHTGGPSVGSMPYLPNVHHPRSPVPTQVRSGAPGQFNPAWGRPRGSLQGFNVASNMMQAAQLEAWEAGEQPAAQSHGWGRPLRRGASVMELGAPCGCAHCTMPWRYGSCANLDHPWLAPPAWPACCAPHPAHLHHATPHPPHAPQTPQPYRRAESRAVSRATSRAPSPAMSVRSRASRRAKPRSPSPPLPSSDADSESEDDAYPSSVHSKHKSYVTPARDRRSSRENKDLNLPERNQEKDEDSLGPAPPPPDATWQCEHCTFVNEPGVRVCVVCCRTPTVTPKIIEKTSDITSIINGMERIKIAEKQTPSPASKSIEQQPKQDVKSRSNKEKISTGCGPSPPREEKSGKGQPKPTKGDIFEPRACHDNVASADTPTKSDIFEPRVRHDIAVGPSPPKEVKYKNHSAIESQEASQSVRASPYRTVVVSQEAHTKHSISVGPSPPKEIAPKQYSPIQITVNNRQQSPGTSPPQRVIDRAPSSSSSRNVSNTGTSPPPQSISTQTYEVPSNWERAPSAQRSRPRRRFRDDARRERSHSRHSLSSDTRESERSVRSGRTSGGGRWEWHEAGSPAERPEWPGERLARRASHLDLRRPRADRPDRSARRTSLYGSEAPSPEPLSGGRAMSLEALAGAGSKREAERGLELARLMSEAERLGFSAAEVHAALAQNPMAPLSWLRERWPSLCAGVRAAAARLAPGAAVSELEARAALARHRGAMWPAVTDCVERARRQEDIRISEDGRMRGHVWGSPNGVDDDAAPPVLSGGRSHRTRAEESSDEFEVTTNNKFQDDDWMYLPLDIDYKNTNKKEQNRLDNKYANTISNKIAKSYSTASSTEDSANDMNAANEEIKPARNTKTTTIPNDNIMNQSDIAEKLKSLLIQAGIPSINEKLLLKGLLSDTMIKKSENISINNRTENKRNSLDFTHFENDFINAYNELSRSSPLPNVSRQQGRSEVQNHKNSDVQEIKSKTKNENIASSDSKTNAKIKTSRYKSVHKSTRTDSDDEYLVNKKIVTDGAISSTSQSNRHILQSPDPDISQTHMMKNVESNVSSSREEDKSKNLSDMVDNTAKLIQKMKDEIHSDINSLHDQSKSHSDGEISSNDSNFASDEYSNYSNSHNESEDLSSAEKETTSSEEETNKHSEKTENTPATRTSSEENEQFEEAMDHIDDQIEDFKQTNIEILDSIAKSLQEEHTFTVEINESKQTGQDVNNNLFDAVNSFDEIYEQLNSNTVEIIAPTPNESTQDSKLFSSPEKPPKIVIKQNLNLTHYNPEFQTRVEITENKLQPMNASITNIELQSIRMTHYNPEFPTKVFISQTKPQVLVATINELSDSFNENSDTSEESDSDKVPQIVSDNQVETPEEMKGSNVNQSESNYNPVPHVTIQLTPGIPHSQTQSDPKTQQPPFEDTNEVLDEHKSGIVNVQVESDKSISSNATAISNEENIAKPKLVNTNKSNIPKLVRLTQNNKTKPDKNTSKVISSKVPVRRGSIKQYPAPAPPKTHFGNVQSGHVKHLQNQLFNGKQVKNASITNAAPEVKPTTSSTLSKKKPAPKPPLTIEKQPSPTKTSPTEKKDNFFRETCRTEDEWSDSGSDDSDQQTITGTKEFEPPHTPSAPQPITLRRISGQFIDLARVQLPEGSPERQARMLLAEGATESWEQAQLAVELISRGTEPPAALLAALECADLSTALAYLQQDCELCAAKFPEFEMVSMLRCTHRCCRECARHYFTVQISERSIADCVCPYCKEPELENLPEDSWLEYFAHLDIQLKTLVDPDLHELFQRKLRDRTLARDPNFRWCVECSSGFFVHPKQKKLRCPECKSISCATCRKPWSPNHEGLTCEQYTTWLDDNDPEKSVAAVQQHLRENGLDCPRCHFKYSLSRGGCMHFTCTQCKYEFCYGCGKPFMMGARCGLSEYCARLGLHAHHPRNCLFYLRDKEPHELQTLLQMNNVSYETEAPAGGSARCPLQLQRETPAGLVDAACGSEVLPNQAGLCKAHYVEYLAAKARALDPIPIMDVSELVAELRRRALPLPERGPWDTDPIYAGICAEIVREKIPLD